MDKSERQKLSEGERRILARETAADEYDRGWPMRTTMGNLAREGFLVGWDAAVKSVSQETEPHCATCRCEGRNYVEDDGL